MWLVNESAVVTVLSMLESGILSVSYDCRKFVVLYIRSNSNGNLYIKRAARFGV